MRRNPTLPRRRRQRGTVTIWFAVGMVPLVGLMGVALDFGKVVAAHSAAQAYVDAQAVAALKEEFGNPAQEVEIGHFLGTLAPGTAITEDVEPGIWRFGGSTFVPGTSFGDLDEDEVPARFARLPADGIEIPLQFGALFGVPSVRIHAEATAFAPRREVIIVQDVSGSMSGSAGGGQTKIEAAVDANLTMVDLMASQAMPGDEVGLVAFDDGIHDEWVVELGLLSDQQATLEATISDMTHVGGTSIATGLERANDMFDTGPNPHVERIVILVSDGIDGGLSDSIEQADAAADKGAHVFTILFGDGGASEQDYLTDLVRGRGRFENAPDSDALAGLMVDIVTGVPMRLVR